MTLALGTVEAVAEGVYVADADLNVVVGNRAFSRITGYTPEDASRLGAAFLARVVRDLELAENALNELWHTGRWEGQVGALRKCGQPYQAQVSATLVRDLEGEVSHYVVVFSDLSRLH
jgi:PAS domain S-box-containing protein